MFPGHWELIITSERAKTSNERDICKMGFGRMKESKIGGWEVFQRYYKDGRESAGDGGKQAC